MFFLWLVSLFYCFTMKCKSLCTKAHFPFVVSSSGPRWRVPHETGVGSEAVSDPERLPLGERRHQPPEPAAAFAAGGVRQKADVAAG